MKHFFYKLDFRGPLHISDENAAYDNTESYIHSDGLMAAVIATNALLGQLAFETEALRLSSAFLYYDNELFFPRPQSPLPGIKNTEQTKLAKKYKKIRWIAQSRFEKLIAGETEEWDSDCITANGEFVCSKQSKLIGNKAVKLWNRELQERVNMQDPEGDTLPYQMERIRFEKQAGLFFIAEIRDDYVEHFESCLRLLGDQGYGTDRSVGNGQFNFEKANYNLKTPESSSGMLLSLYCPSVEERWHGFSQEANYTLLRRGGYLASARELEHRSRKKNFIYMFAEGSVFDNYKARKGYVANLNPSPSEIQHPVWRDGRAFFVPIVPLRY